MLKDSSNWLLIKILSIYFILVLHFFLFLIEKLFCLALRFNS